MVWYGMVCGMWYVIVYGWMICVRYGGKVTRRVVVCLMIVVVELFGRGVSFFGGPCSLGALGNSEGGREGGSLV